MVRKQRRRRASVPGLTWRAGVAYWQRAHARLPKGRVYKSLETRDPEQATIRATLLNRIGWERGSWDLVARWVGGELDITDLIRADREGGDEWKRLRRTRLDGLRLGETADAFLAQSKATQAALTYEKYRLVIDAARRHFGDDCSMGEIGTKEAAEYLHAKKETTGAEWSPRTLAHHRNTLGALWKYAMEREEEDARQTDTLPSIQFNPWRRTKAPKLRRTRFSYLSPEEARALLLHDDVRGTPVAALLAVAIYAGLRLSEITHLRTDIDVLLGASPRLSAIVVQGREGEHAWAPKTDRSTRRLTPIPALHELLVAHRDRYAGDRYFFPPESGDHPADRSTVKRWVRDAFTSAGIKYGRRGDALTLHSLRHTFVTWQVAAGIPLPTVARRAGDSELVILRTYAHCMPEQDARADEVLEAAARVELRQPASKRARKAANA